MTMQEFNAIGLESSSDRITMHPTAWGIDLGLTKDRLVDFWHETRLDADRVYAWGGGSSILAYRSMYAA
jgi:hypothetical protein